MAEDPIARLRSEYRAHSLDEAGADPDPLVQFGRWFDEAVRAKVREPNAMTLATVRPDGQPAARIVLLKGTSGGRFVFFTNLDSKKGQELAAAPRAALVFFWPELERQVRVEGATERVSDAEADAYFATRPRGSQLGAWASAQSSVLTSRAALEGQLALVKARFGDGPVPRPPRWGGYAVVPSRLELWQGRESRLHDRLVYVRQGDGTWRRERLSP